MVIKIVTDSTADLPQSLIEELGITVVPLYVQFGDKTYRDPIDISKEEFYQKLLSDPVHPNTSQPNPQDFTDIYQELSKQAEGIISIHISSKLSGTYNSALQAKELLAKECPVEVVDSEMVSMGLGLIVVEAATMARSGQDLHHIAEGVKQLIPETHVWALFDTLKYLALGGRIGKAKELLGSVLNIKPVLVVKDGEMAPATQARSRSKGIDSLYGFANNFTDIKDLAVMYTTTLNEAETLAERLKAIFNQGQIKIVRLGSALGVHAGPGALAIALRGK